MPPAIRPTIGMTMSFTRELTMAVKAPPTATPTASSTTEPRLINSMNSFLKPEDFSRVLARTSLALAVLVVGFFEVLSDILLLSGFRIIAKLSVKIFDAGIRGSESFFEAVVFGGFDDFVDFGHERRSLVNHFVGIDTV